MLGTQLTRTTNFDQCNDFVRKKFALLFRYMKHNNDESITAVSKSSLSFILFLLFSFYHIFVNFLLG